MNIKDILGYQLNVSAKLITRTMQKSISKYGITTSQWAVIKLLDTQKELTQIQIAGKLHGDKVTTGDVVLRLCEKGFLKKSVNENDKRAYLISLTQKSKSIIKDVEKMADAAVIKALNNFSEDEIEMLHKALNKIIVNLDGGE